MHTHRSQGFTLIELLVVIAIIGILSAVVLASLNTARNKGNDAAVQTDLATIRVQAEIYYGSTGENSYAEDGTGNNDGACTAGLWAEPTILKAITHAENVNGASITLACNANTTNYAVSAGLLQGIGGKMNWCVDSAGNANAIAVKLGNGVYTCPAS